MSSGSFELSKYEADNDEIHPIRIQEETTGITIGGQANTAPTAAATSSISARVSGGNRRFGLKARTVSFAFKGTAPANYKADSPIRLPVLKKSTYAVIAKGQTFQYLGQTATVIGKQAERVN